MLIELVGDIVASAALGQRFGQLGVVSCFCIFCQEEVYNLSPRLSRKSKNNPILAQACVDA